MNFIKSIFSKPSTPQFQQKSKNQTSDFSILDPQFTQVRLSDAKLLIKDMKKLEQVLNYQPESINEQLKKCYALHIILSSDQSQVIDKVVQYCEQNHIKPIRQNIQTKTAATTNLNQTCQIMSDQQMIATQFQNSMYLNVSDVIIIFIQQLQFYEQIHQNESEFTNIYFNYIQRVTQNSDIYNSCKFHQYPYEDEAFNRKLQFVWLFKIINMLNYKLAFIPNLQFLFICKTQNTFIIRDVAYLVYKDCLLEYGFLRNEISDMVESYSQFQVREALQFYELVVFMLQINKKMKLFYDMRQQFALNSQSVRDVKWFEIDKKQLIEIEHYISKAKLLNTVQFKKSLMVPTQKNQIENLQKFIFGPSLLENSFLKVFIFYMPRNLQLPNILKKIKLNNILPQTLNKSKYQIIQDNYQKIDK